MLDLSPTKEKPTTKNNQLMTFLHLQARAFQDFLNEIHNKTAKKIEETPVLSRERHIKIMKNILEILSDLEFKGNLDIAAFEYRAALNLCMEINQKFDIEKILDIIFRDFCIGK